MIPSIDQHRIMVNQSSFGCFYMAVHAVMIVGLTTAQPVPSCECSDQLFDQSPKLLTTTAYYCGSDLNRLLTNTTTCTDNKLYLCTRHNKVAVPIGHCPRAKKSLHGCNDSFKSRNDCLRNLKCSCRSLARLPRSSQQVSCGQQLQGLDCIPNVIYQCRLIGSPLPLQNCPHGCTNGKCTTPIVEVSLEEVDKPPTESRKPKPRSRTNGTGRPNGTSPEEDHEVEFVTFAPLIGIPLFNP